MSKSIKITPEMIAQMNAKSKEQEVKRGYSPTHDTDFPMFRTPVNEDILVYLPMTNIIDGDNGEELDLLEAYLHDYKEGTMYGQARCISGLTGGIFEDVLEYDGDCPYCKATSSAWDLYRVKLEAEAAKMGISDPQNDKSESLQGIKRGIIQDMDLQGPEEYVVFPIVIIPIAGQKGINIEKNAFEKDKDGNYVNLEVVYVQWKKKRFEDNILGALDGMMSGPSHPCGLLWLWKFTYDTKGKQATARDSALNAKYHVLVDEPSKNIVAKHKDALEEAAAEFTNVKATEVIKAIEYKHIDDVQEHANKVIKRTNSLLEMSEIGKVSAPQVTGNNLENFGKATTEPIGLETGNTGVEVETEGIKFGE